MEYYSARKRNEILSSGTTWMELEIKETRQRETSTP
jgi:hypothetical protein